MSPTLVPCESCGKPVNDRFAKCPLCNAPRRPSVDVRPMSLDKGYTPPPGGIAADPSLSKEQRIEIAKNVFTGRLDQPVTGATSGLLGALLPSGNTRGWMRNLEIVLTVISFPFFVASMAGIIIQGVKRWGKIDALSWVLGSFLGSLAFGLGLYMVGVPPRVTWWVIGVGFAAWSGRGVVRFVAAAQRLSDNT